MVKMAFFCLLSSFARCSLLYTACCSIPPAARPSLLLRPSSWTRKQARMLSRWATTLMPLTVASDNIGFALCYRLCFCSCSELELKRSDKLIQSHRARFKSTNRIAYLTKELTKELQEKRRIEGVENRA
jgi:hypothetical protein